jgi:hypothetical protein
LAAAFSGSAERTFTRDRNRFDEQLTDLPAHGPKDAAIHVRETYRGNGVRVTAFDRLAMHVMQHVRQIFFGFTATAYTYRDILYVRALATR